MPITIQEGQVKTIYYKTDTQFPKSMGSCCDKMYIGTDQVWSRKYDIIAYNGVVSGSKIYNNLVPDFMCCNVDGQYRIFPPSPIAFSGQIYMFYKTPITHLGIDDLFTSNDWTNINLSISLRQTSITTIDASTFAGLNLCSSPSLLSIWLPWTITTIGDYAFSNMGRLSSVYISRKLGRNAANLQSIGNHCFEGSSYFAQLHCFASAAPTLGTDAFKDTSLVDGSPLIHI
jgi:hypothetical protein